MWQGQPCRAERIPRHRPHRSARYRRGRLAGIHRRREGVPGTCDVPLHHGRLPGLRALAAEEDDGGLLTPTTRSWVHHIPRSLYLLGGYCQDLTLRGRSAARLSAAARVPIRGLPAWGHPAHDAAVSARQRSARGFRASPGCPARVRPVRAAHARPGIVDGEIIAGQRENVPPAYLLRSTLPTAALETHGYLLGVRSYHARNRTWPERKPAFISDRAC